MPSKEVGGRARNKPKCFRKKSQTKSEYIQRETPLPTGHTQTGGTTGTHNQQQTTPNRPKKSEKSLNKRTRY